jgi:hypothetical protein
MSSRLGPLIQCKYPPDECLGTLWWLSSHFDSFCLGSVPFASFCLDFRFERLGQPHRWSPPGGSGDPEVCVQDRVRH